MHRNGISILDKLYLWILTEYVIYEVRIAVHNSSLYPNLIVARLHLLDCHLSSG